MYIQTLNMVKSVNCNTWNGNWCMDIRHNLTGRLWCFIFLTESVLCIFIFLFVSVKFAHWISGWTLFSIQQPFVIRIDFLSEICIPIYILLVLYLRTRSCECKEGNYSYHCKHIVIWWMKIKFIQHFTIILKFKSVLS